MRMRTKSGRGRRVAGIAGAALAAVLVLAGCDDGAGKASSASSPTASVSESASESASASASASPSEFPTPTRTPSPSHTPTRTESPTHPPTRTHAPTRVPTHKATPTPARTHATYRPTTAPGGGSGTRCEITSNAGNCYRAGQFCRKADVGRSTHDASGRIIKCGYVSGRPHWHY
ncbi:hypothetical protein [Streptomyces sp. NPDC059009]|uniref:hypothetical protein n=1 Tax=Streptomyces sp. NPDC059009 TaxID=3346694 RepID=UPI003695D993